MTWRVAASLVLSGVVWSLLAASLRPMFDEWRQRRAEVKRLPPIRTISAVRREPVRRADPSPSPRGGDAA